MLIRMHDEPLAEGVLPDGLHDVPVLDQTLVVEGAGHLHVVSAEAGVADEVLLGLAVARRGGFLVILVLLLVRTLLLDLLSSFASFISTSPPSFSSHPTVLGKTALGCPRRRSQPSRWTTRGRPRWPTPRLRREDQNVGARVRDPSALGARGGTGRRGGRGEGGSTRAETTRGDARRAAAIDRAGRRGRSPPPDMAPDCQVGFRARRPPKKFTLRSRAERGRVRRRARFACRPRRVERSVGGLAPPGDPSGRAIGRVVRPERPVVALFDRNPD